ncbi:MAG: Nif3-like dinuclear metal center hexameric protein [Candidatus Limivivens sp.]|nr:Nif3-like dinuclear metal center hexameric protein [Candidatus Limivivens sp.]
MNGRILISRLEETYPRHIAESWDNPGLQAGRRDREIRKVYIALDASDEAIEQAAGWGADLLLTHHPLLMSGIKGVTADDLPGRRLLRLIESGVACYSMHTNYDIVSMGQLAADRMGLQNAEVLTETGTDPQTGAAMGFGRIGSLPGSMTLAACGELVKEKFGLSSVKLFGDPERIVERAAILPGSGKSMVGDALKKQAQVMISGDFGHHDGLDAADQGLMILDAGHYGIEHIFIAHMAGYLRTCFPELEIREAPLHHPFQVI